MLLGCLVKGLGFNGDILKVFKSESVDGNKKHYVRLWVSVLFRGLTEKYSLEDRLLDSSEELF